MGTDDTLNKLDELRESLESEGDLASVILHQVAEAVLNACDSIIAARREQQDRFSVELALDRLASTIGTLHAMLARTRAEYHS